MAISNLHKFNPSAQVTDWITKVISVVPEPVVEGHPSDEEYIKKMIRHSALNSSSVSASLVLPGGVLGIVSMIPDIAAVWKIQSQLISDIAAAHGKSSLVSREQKLWCMFRQVAAGALKEVIVQQGTKYVVRQTSDKLLKIAIGKIGQGIIRRQSTKAASKIVPLLGSVSAGAFTYWDTYRVGKNAHEFCSKEVILLPPSAAEEIQKS